MKPRYRLAVIHYFESLWYGRRPLAQQLWWPLSVLFCAIAALRKVLLTRQQIALPVPVIVVGNLAVGGTGKTPLVIYLANLLTHAGYKVGIVSRGYGAKSPAAMVRSVTYHSSAVDVGDEALVLATRTSVPVVVGRDRVKAIQYLLDTHPCQMILADDGLQHYKMARAIELVVVDGQRRLGNGLCIPAGPLRERPERLKTVDFVIHNGQHPPASEYAMRVSGHCLQALHDANLYFNLAEWQGRSVHVVTAIGNPERFVQLLQQAGLECHVHRFPDHYLFQAHDLEFADHLPIIMTEKDAVKCRQWAQANPSIWYLPVNAQLDFTFDHAFLERVAAVTEGLDN